jgi:3-hydroxyisobutyrate dehydrogenase-like beta-hydroxyacid dehydrogenase
MPNFALVGFGEVGSIFARDLAKAAAQLGRADKISVFDISQTARERARTSPGVDVAASAATVARGAEIVIVAVTAGSTLVALSSLTGGLEHSPYVLDVNSVAPATKQKGAEIVAAAGGKYVEAAVMTSVPPKGFASPMLLGGEHAEPLAALLAPYGATMTPFGEIGRPSSVKMCRSVMTKGLEALAVECLSAARAYGVEADVLASLSDTLPHEDWGALARYLISRALIHGKRRAEEMREVVKTVEAAGIKPAMTPAIVEKQEFAGQIGARIGRDRVDTLSLKGILDLLTPGKDEPFPRGG